MFSYHYDHDFFDFLEYNGIQKEDFLTATAYMAKLLHIDKNIIKIFFTIEESFLKRFNGSANRYNMLENVYDVNIYHGQIKPFKWFPRIGKKISKESIYFTIAHEMAHVQQFHQDRLSLAKDPTIRDILYVKWQGHQIQFKAKNRVPQETYMRFPWEHEANRFALNFCRTMFPDVDLPKILSKSITPDFGNIENILKLRPLDMEVVSILTKRV